MTHLPISTPRDQAAPRPFRSSRARFPCGCFGALLFWATVLSGIGRVGLAQAPWPVYTDSLVDGFQDWSWATRDLANAAPVHSGSHSIAVTIDSAWVGLQIYHPDVSTAAYRALHFWANGGATGGQKVQVYALAHVGTTNNAAQGHLTLSPFPRNAWQEYTVDLSTLGVASRSNFTGFVIQDVLGKAQPTFYLDDIDLLPASAPSAVHLSVDVAKNIRGVDARWFGVNTAIWDAQFDTPETVDLLREMGTRVLRGPGGSLSDEYHWLTDTTLNNTWKWATSFAAFVHVATNVNAQTFITVNYGTGSSNEAAAWVAYANASPTNNLPLGSDASGTDWKTAGFWAALRASSPLAKDDGRNFLRLSRSAPLGFRSWEIGNECYGTWETDNNPLPHDAYTYAARTRGYLNLMKAVDPSIQVGVVVVPGEDANSNGYTSHAAINPRTGQSHRGWTPVLFSTLRQMDAIPDFAVHHWYPEFTDQGHPTGSDDDASLLQSTRQWQTDASELRQEILDYFGPLGTNVELVCTENNSDAGAQGRQSTSLVNGLYYADSLAQLMQTEFNAFIWWDLRNGTDTNGSFDDTLYGWRAYGDLGMINGLQTRHPTFFAAKLMHAFARPSDTLVAASSDYSLLSAYAARQTDGTLNLLVLNKSSVLTLNSQIALDGFMPNPSATLSSYGIPQDEAARANGPVEAQDIQVQPFTGVSSTFERSFPPLSITLMSLPPALPELSIQSALPSHDLLIRVRAPLAGRCELQISSDLENWSSVFTNVVSNQSLEFEKRLPAEQQVSFFRAVWAP